MSEILNTIVQSKVTRLIQLAVLATNQYKVQRGDWSFQPLEDEKANQFEKNVNDPESEFYGRTDLLRTFEALYALEGKKFPAIRTVGQLPHVGIQYGVVVVPTEPVLGEIPDIYTEDWKYGYVLGKPYMAISTWKEKTEAGNPQRRGRGENSTLAALSDIPFLPTRIDLLRPATDSEVVEVVNKLVADRGVAFVTDVLKNLEETYAFLLA